MDQETQRLKNVEQTTFLAKLSQLTVDLTQYLVSQALNLCYLCLRF